MKRHIFLLGTITIIVVVGLFSFPKEAPGPLPLLTEVYEEEIVVATQLSVVLTAAAPKSPFTNYQIRPGDTLSGIAQKHSIDIQTIAYANGIAVNSLLQVGRTLLVPLHKGAVHTVRSGDTLWDIARAYKVSVASISEVNPTVDPGALKLNEKLLIPGAKQVQAQPASKSGNSFIWPAVGRITSPFGPRWGTLHAGIDLGIRTGTAVRAARAGTVTFSGWSGGYGYLVKISHSGGYETRYAHNSRLVAKAGDKVTAGQLVAYSGNTGNSTGPHLHFEIRHQGVARNPRLYLP